MPEQKKSSPSRTARYAKAKYSTTASPPPRRTQRSTRPPQEQKRSAPSFSSPAFGYAILPLRVFLGFTMIFAGLQKLASSNFFKASYPGSIQAQFKIYMVHSPIHALLTPLAGAAGAIGVIIAFGELAVGLGTLLGVLSRVAALGGMLISLSLFLVVSFHTNPYYTGSDIVFMFAFIPLVIRGDGGVFSLSRTVLVRNGIGSKVQPVEIGFETLSSVCAHRSGSHCTIQGANARCEAVHCPILHGGEGMVLLPLSGVSQRDASDLDRRKFLTKAAVASSVGVVGLIGAGAAKGLGSVLASSTSTTTTPTTPTTAATTPTTAAAQTAGGAATTTTYPGSVANPSGKEIGLVSQLSSGQIASFTDPSTGSPAYIIHPKGGRIYALSAVCPHAGCTVQWNSGSFLCPCHGSAFSAKGVVLNGPAQANLSSITVEIGTNGKIYVVN